jgi:hypothetical protein
MGEENRTTQLLEEIADELFVFRKDQQEQEDQESGRAKHLEEWLAREMR